MLTLVIVLKGLAEVILAAFLAQGVLYLLAGRTRDTNPLYKLFVIITRPIWVATRFITPRVIVDAHVGFVAFFLVGVLWFGLLLAKAYYVLTPASA